MSMPMVYVFAVIFGTRHVHGVFIARLRKCLRGPFDIKSVQQKKSRTQMVRDFVMMDRKYESLESVSDAS